MPNRREEVNGDPSSDLLLKNQICFILYTASRLSIQVYQPLLAKLNLTYSQYLVMIVLWEADGLSVGELGSKLFLDSGTLSPLLKKLEIKGYVHRERQIKDERSVRIKLTDEGRALQGSAKKVPEEMLCATRMSLVDLNMIKEKLDLLSGGLLKQLEH